MRLTQLILLISLFLTPFFADAKLNSIDLEKETFGFDYGDILNNTNTTLNETGFNWTNTTNLNETSPDINNTDVNTTDFNNTNESDFELPNLNETVTNDTIGANETILNITGLNQTGNFTNVTLSPIINVTENETIIQEIETGEHYYSILNGKVIASINNDVEYLHRDRLGSNIVSSGDSIKRNKNLPFGQEISNDGITYSFTGKELDDNDLYYFVNRYYNPDSGRFLETDSVFTEKTYVYANNNPLLYVDPDGDSIVAMKGDENYLRKNLNKLLESKRPAKRMLAHILVNSEYPRVTLRQENEEIVKDTPFLDGRIYTLGRTHKISLAFMDGENLGLHSAEVVLYRDTINNFRKRNPFTPNTHENVLYHEFAHVFDIIVNAENYLESSKLTNDDYEDLIKDIINYARMDEKRVIKEIGRKKDDLFLQMLDSFMSYEEFVKDDKNPIEFLEFFETERKEFAEYSTSE